MATFEYRCTVCNSQWMGNELEPICPKCRAPEIVNGKRLIMKFQDEDFGLPTEERDDIDEDSPSCSMWAVLAAVVFLAACASPARFHFSLTGQRFHPQSQYGDQVKSESVSRRYAYVHKNDLAREVRKAILRGRLVAGMSAEEVKASIGPPIKIYNGHSADEWTYELTSGDQKRIYLRDGILFHAVKKSNYD